MYGCVHNGENCRVEAKNADNIGFSTLSTGFSTMYYVYWIVQLVGKTGDIMPVKEKNKVEIHKNIFAGFCSSAVVRGGTHRRDGCPMKGRSMDTIAAVATGLPGAIGILRLSGPEAVTIAAQVFRSADGKELREHWPRKLIYGSLMGREGRVIDHMVCTYSIAPASYTGEDTVELQCHGGAVAVRRTLEAVLSQKNVRSAEPGEFTMRAFINGKLDLAQAEAVGDLITSSSDATFDLALRQLEGALSLQVNDIREILLLLAADCESRLDFPDEELEFDSAEELVKRLQKAENSLQKLIDSAHAGAVLREGVRITLAGKPNAGKSSLLNALLGIDRAIVSDIPGTTRDTLAERAVLRNIAVEITDTAGLRDSSDTIEALGIERARAAMRQAQVVFYLLDASQDDLAEELAEFENVRSSNGNQLIAVWNKLDLVPGKILPELKGCAVVKISAHTGENLDSLLDAFENIVWQGRENAVDTPTAVNARHLELLQNAQQYLEPVAGAMLNGNWELAGADLRLALLETGRIVGETVEPDLLDEIFSRFCIGK